MKTIHVQGQGHFKTMPDSVILHGRTAVYADTWEKAMARCEWKLKVIENFAKLDYSELIGASFGKSRVMVEPLDSVSGCVKGWAEIKLRFGYNMHHFLKVINGLFPRFCVYASSVEFVAKDAKALTSDLFCTAFEDARRKAVTLCEKEGATVGDVIEFHTHWHSRTELRVPLNSFFLENLDFTNIISPCVPDITTIDFVFAVQHI